MLSTVPLMDKKLEWFNSPKHIEKIQTDTAHPLFKGLQKQAGFNSKIPNNTPLLWRG